MSGEYLLRKLHGFGALPAATAEAVLALGTSRVRTLGKGRDVIRQGDDPKDVYLIVEGWACRYKSLDDGARQIVSLFVPGDLCDLHVYVLKEIDYSIGALTPIRFARVSAREMEALCDAHPRVVRALWWESLVNASIQREWTVNVGQRDALESLAHLICEMYMRIRAVGLTEGRACAFPLTQQDMADALGLTQTHVGRVVAKLNASGCATLHRRRLEVTDLRALKRLARFNPNYLHQLGDT